MSGVSTTLNEALERAVGKPATGLRFLNRHESAELLPYEEIHRRALDVAGRLHAAGVRRGERVALVYPTSPEFIAALFGALLAGAVPVPLYPPVRLGRLAEYLVQTSRLLHVSGAVLVLADPKVRRVLGEAVASVRPRLGCKTLHELPAGVPTSVGVSPADLALVQFSSGTTVDPKPVALSHRAIKAQVDILNASWPRDTGAEPSGVSWLPLYHDMGLIGCVFTAVSYPGTLTLLPPEAFIARPALWLRAISRYRAMISVAPNFGYALAKAKIKDEELEGVDLSSWLFALNGAEAVAPSVLRGFSDRFERWGFRREAMTPVYGLSEAALAVTFSKMTRSIPVRRFARAALSRGVAEEAVEGRELASVGRPLSGFSLRVADDSGRDQPERRIGRIFVRGPSLMDGYLGAPEATAAVLKDGWLDTGDLGFLLEGELYLTGRAKDILILRGRNHAPEEVEQAVEGIPGLRPGCAVAVSYLAEEAEGERLVLFVERARERKRKETDAEIASRCRREVRIATGLSAEDVRVLEPGTIPRTSSGKKRRGETLRRHLEGTLLPPENVSPLKLLRAMARSRAAFRNAKREAP